MFSTVILALFLILYSVAEKQDMLKPQPLTTEMHKTSVYS